LIAPHPDLKLRRRLALNMGSCLSVHSADASSINSTALLVIDVQRGLFEQTPPPADAEAVIARINDLARRARATGTPVIFIQHERPDGPLAHGSPGWQLALGLNVDPGDRRVRKTSPDSFLRTELADVLHAFGITRVVVCGYATEFCIDTTVRRAAALGFEVVLAADAHTTQDKPHATATQIRAHHNATLPCMISFGPRISATPTVEVKFRSLASTASC